MSKKVILLLIFLFVISCTSPFGQTGIKFKDRNGIYQNSDKKITLTVTKEDKQNLIIDMRDFNGVTVTDTYDINSAVITGNFTLYSKNNKEYAYIINFYANTSITFSVRKGIQYLIKNVELRNTSIK
ncbi:hypothetical protein [Brachyspira sp.]|uniref:hypothetical protein n=1 Tax=Brachyspira sp. TaxID=1977261 RepID=UPI0026195DCC|nr:hypothetical protein [Brachyspira sp.]